MATIDDVYGTNFNQEAFAGRVNHIVDLIASNFANLSFQLRHNYSPVFRRGGMDPKEIAQIVAKTQTLNPNLIVTPIDKNSEQVRMLPYLLTIPAEYFRVTDISRQKIYLVYVSTENMEAY